MNINKYLLDFLESYVNINDTRLGVAESNIWWVTKAIENSEKYWSVLIWTPSPQGSLRHKTIIKPVHENDTFDTDLLVEIEKPNHWSYSDCLTNLREVFLWHGVYKDKLDPPKTRCITINYAWQNSIDIVPTFQENWDYYIVNWRENIAELSDWDWFSKWFDLQDKKTWWNLRKVIRLLKYIRNYHELFDIKSIHLNILIWKAVNVWWDFSNLENSLISIIKSLNRYLLNKNHVYELDLINPANPREDMGEWSRNLEDEELIKFKTFISSLNSILNSWLTDEEVVVKLRPFLWDEFWDTYFDNICWLQEYQWDDIFESMKLLWKTLHWSIKIGTVQYIKNNDIKYLKSWYQINTEIELTFKCEVVWVHWPYEIHWQVLNTWEEAKHAEWGNGLRWDFFKGKLINWKINNDQHINEEKTAYKWIHWIKCFLIQDKYLVAESSKFYVKIV